MLRCPKMQNHRFLDTLLIYCCIYENKVEQNICIIYTKTMRIVTIKFKTNENKSVFYLLEWMTEREKTSVVNSSLNKTIYLIIYRGEIWIFLLLTYFSFETKNNKIYLLQKFGIGICISGIIGSIGREGSSIVGSISRSICRIALISFIIIHSSASGLGWQENSSPKHTHVLSW